MAYEKMGERNTQTAGADLTGKENRFLKGNGTDHTVIIATDGASPLAGVLTAGGPTGSGVGVQVSSYAKVLSGAAVTKDALVTSDGTGRAVDVASAVGNKYVGGRATEGCAAANVMITVDLHLGQINTAVS